MAFTGKSTCSKDMAFPEQVEDLSDLVGIISSYETPLLCALGDSFLDSKDDQDIHDSNVQLFTALVEAGVANTLVSQLGLANEMDYQKQERLRYLLRSLENAVINGVPPSTFSRVCNPAHRKIRGIIQQLYSNVFFMGDKGFPDGKEIDDKKLSYVLQQLREAGNDNTDAIVVNEIQKRNLAKFCDSHGISMGLCQGSFGVYRLVTSRWMPQDTILILDSSDISVSSQAGKSFHFSPLAGGKNYESGVIVGEYVLELKNEAAHAVICGLATY